MKKTPIVLITIAAILIIAFVTVSLIPTIGQTFIKEEESTILPKPTEQIPSAGSLNNTK